MPSPKKETLSDTGVVVIGATKHPLRDAYVSVLRMRWAGVLAGIAAVFLAMNVLFAFAYMVTGGLVGAKEGAFGDAFFFSVQTMGTIGYGAIYPSSTAANVLVVAESVVGLILTALATGIVFARFTQTTGTMMFSNKVCIGLHDAEPTLMFRVGNDRESTIFEATVTVIAIRTVKTAEGALFYRMLDLPLVRQRSPALQRSWTVMHRLDDASPLAKMTPDTCKADELELQVVLVGTDDTSLQPVHARRRYELKDFVWGARPADVLTERPDGLIELDVRKFHDTTPTSPTPDFPYPRPREA